MTTAYADASAIVKLVVEERESAACAHFLAEFDEVVTSRLGLVETARAVARWGGPPESIDAVGETLGVIELGADIAATAGLLSPPSLRTLDALHLASALALYHLDAFVTYDERLGAAARAAGLPVASPR
jgi:predicted nucleic acid-binding protein